MLMNEKGEIDPLTIGMSNEEAAIQYGVNHTVEALVDLIELFRQRVLNDDPESLEAMIDRMRDRVDELDGYREDAVALMDKDMED